jgi:hypothetical protein
MSHRSHTKSSLKYKAAGMVAKIEQLASVDFFASNRSFRQKNAMATKNAKEQNRDLIFNLSTSWIRGKR